MNKKVLTIMLLMTKSQLKFYKIMNKNFNNIPGIKNSKTFYFLQKTGLFTKIIFNTKRYENN